MNTETVLYKGSPSLVTQLGSLILAGLAIVGALAGAFLVSIWLLILAGAGLIFGLVRVVLVKSIVYELTSERIKITRGILTKRTDEVELYRVKDATLVEPVLLRAFSLGNIELATNDASTPSLTLAAVPDAKNLREQLRAGIEACRDRKGVKVTEFE